MVWHIETIDIDVIVVLNKEEGIVTYQAGKTDNPRRLSTTNFWAHFAKETFSVGLCYFDVNIYTIRENKCKKNDRCSYPLVAIEISRYFGSWTPCWSSILNSWLDSIILHICTLLTFLLSASVYVTIIDPYILLIVICLVCFYSCWRWWTSIAYTVHIEGIGCWYTLSSL